MTKTEFWASLSTQEKELMREMVELFNIKYEEQPIDRGVIPFKSVPNPEMKCWWMRSTESEDD
jgi:hypothetical protein